MSSGWQSRSKLRHCLSWTGGITLPVQVGVAEISPRDRCCPSHLRPASVYSQLDTGHEQAAEKGCFMRMLCIAGMGSVCRRPCNGASWMPRSSMFRCFVIFGSPLRCVRRHLSRSRTQPTDAHEIVGRAGQPHQLRVAPDAPQSGLAQTTYGLAPTKELFNVFANNLTGSIAARVEGASIRAGGVVSGVDSHMQRDALREQAIDEAARVITLVAADTFGPQPLASLPRQQCQGRFRLGYAHRRGETYIADQTVAIIHQGVPGKAQLGFLAQSFAQELRFRVRRARVCVVAAPLALKVAIPTGIGPRAAAGPAQPPQIRPNYLTADYDRKTAAAAYRFVRNIFQQPALQAVLRDNAIPQDLRSDDEIIDLFGRQGAPGYHTVGTCSIGGDPASVVDPRLRGRGVDGLPVMDAFIIPILIAGHTNAPVMAMSWRAADLILEDSR